jgi:hypothetical protein
MYRNSLTNYVKVTICGSVNNVKNHTNFHLLMRKYGRNSSEIVKPYCVHTRPSHEDSELYPFAFTKGTKQTHTGRHKPEGCKRMRLAEFLHNRHMNVASLPTQGNGRIYPPGDIAGFRWYKSLIRPQAFGVAARN